MPDYEAFCSNLLATNSDTDRMDFVRKFIFHGTPIVFKDREHDYFEFRNRIAKKFNVNFFDVFIVGSSKFGFNFRTGKPFDYDSDIDVVIVNEAMFDEYFKKICDYQYKLDVEYREIEIEERQKYADFLRYFVKGWMRPDLLPISFQVNELKNDWFSFFDGISNGRSEVGNYEVNAGLYKNYFFLERYYGTNIGKKYLYLSSKRHTEQLNATEP